MKNNPYENRIVERRRFIRHPIALPLSFSIIKSTVGRPGENTKTTDISIGGLSFPGKHPVKEDSLISIKMPFEDKIFNVRARVVRCQNNPETNLYDIAVKFFRLHEAFKVKMIEQIYLIAEYRDLLRLQTGKEISMEEASQKWIKRYSKRFKRLYW